MFRKHMYYMAGQLASRKFDRKVTIRLVPLGDAAKDIDYSVMNVISFDYSDRGTSIVFSAISPENNLVTIEFRVGMSDAITQDAKSTHIKTVGEAAWIRNCTIVHSYGSENYLVSEINIIANDIPKV